VSIKAETSASAKLGADKAKDLIKDASKIIVMKGKKVTTFDLKKDKPARADLLAVMLGTTGNLRAPTVVRGRTVLIGFNQEIYDEILG
jgi:arsenate reductase-like glutaredoxin family protein